MEGNFSTDWAAAGRQEDGFGMIQAHYIQAHLLLCGLVPNGPGPVGVNGLEVPDPCCIAPFLRLIFESLACSRASQIAQDTVRGVKIPLKKCVACMKCATPQRVK